MPRRPLVIWLSLAVFVTGCPQEAPGATAIASHVDHTCALVNGGKAVCWGHNFRGELGIKSKGTDIYVPLPVVNLPTAAQLSLGLDFSLARVASGKVFGWGKNVTGHFLDGTAQSSPIAKELGSDVALQPVIDICAGGYQVCAVRKADNVVICWGRGTDGEIGNGKKGSNNLLQKPMAVIGAPAAKRVLCGRQHTCSLSMQGQMHCWGRNSSAQLGNGDTKGPATSAVWATEAIAVSKAALGIGHTCALVKGKARCFGRNLHGQVGAGIGSATTIKKAVIVNLPSKAVDVVAGREHSCAALDDGSAWCWGRNQKGQLGNGTFDNAFVPVKVVGGTASGG